MEVGQGCSKVSLTRGENIRFSVRAGATGRMWVVESPQGLQVEDLGIAPSVSFGGLGQQTFVVVCKEPGNYLLRLILKAPWRDSVEEAREVMIHVD